jgi:hypothetical protein
MKLLQNKKIAFVWLFIFFALGMHLSCSLNPLNGMLTSLNVRIDSPTHFAVKKKQDVQLQAAVPVTVPTQTRDFDCIAFNVTGYGIEEKQDVAGSEVPIGSLRFGIETPMQDPDSSANLTFQVQIPNLLGVDPRLQQRFVQIYGVYTSLTDKTACQNKELSEFLVSVDPYAAVYLIGSSYYPEDVGSGNCLEGELCINDDVAEFGPGRELITNNLQSVNTLMPSALYYATNNTSSLSTIYFTNSDLFFGRGSFQNANSSAVSKPTITGYVPRIDLYFQTSTYFLKRLISYSTTLSLSSIKAQEYTTSSSFCNSTLSVGDYSDMQIKIWNGSTDAWVNPPRGSTTSDLNLAAVNLVNYEMPFNLQHENVKTETIDGLEYLIVSLRAKENGIDPGRNCSSLSFSSAVLKFY